VPGVRKYRGSRGHVYFEKTKPNAEIGSQKGLGPISLLALAAMLLSTCTHRRTFSTDMEWYDSRELRRDVLFGYNMSDVVCLKYVDAPDSYECLFAPDIRERLQAFKKMKVRVDFEVTCRSAELVTYRIVAVDGRDVGILQNAITGRMGNRNEYPLFDACL
jgi:hypothetical protein